MKLGNLIKSTLVILGTLFVLALPASAQELPDADYQTILIKSTLMTLNDANLSGNYTVLQRRAAKPFRDAYSPRQLAELFTVFAEEEINIAAILVEDAIPSTETTITDAGVLHMEGVFPTMPSNVIYTLDFVPSDDGWKMIGINVNLAPSEGANTQDTKSE